MSYNLHHYLSSVIKCRRRKQLSWTQCHQVTIHNGKGSMKCQGMFNVNYIHIYVSVSLQISRMRARFIMVGRCQSRRYDMSRMGDFKEKMLFCEELKTTSTPTDIYHLYKCYIHGARIPLTYVILRAADGAPALIGRWWGDLCLMEADNPDMMTAHCVIGRENLVARNLSPKLNEVLMAVIKCISIINSNHKIAVQGILPWDRGEACWTSTAYRGEMVEQG